MYQKGRKSRHIATLTMQKLLETIWKAYKMANKSEPLCFVFVSFPHRVAVHHVKVKPRCAVLTMLKRLDKIRFRGPRTREDFPDLAESPPASDNECNEDVQPKARTAPREADELLRDPVRARKLFCVFVIAFNTLAAGNRNPQKPVVYLYGKWKS